MSFEDVTHETILIKVATSDNNILVIFNVIKSLSYPIILGLLWLKRYNPQIDWIFCNLDFFHSLVQGLARQVEIHKFNISKFLLIDARAFMYAINEGPSFAIYAMPIVDGEKISSGILSQY